METLVIPDPRLIPPTLWRVFSAGFLAEQDAPADAATWYAQGYLARGTQGKLSGYTIAPAGYERLLTRYAQPTLAGDAVS